MKIFLSFNLLILLGILASAAQATPVPPWLRKVDRVEAYSSKTYTVRLRADVPVRLVVDGDTDLDLYVYDENWNLIDSDTDTTDYCITSWTPRWTGRFHIVIRNLGPVYNRYVLTLR